MLFFKRREQLLFPFLEKQGFFGPSKVMWEKDNEIKNLLKKAVLDVNAVSKEEELEEYKKTIILRILL